MMEEEMENALKEIKKMVDSGDIQGAVGAINEMLSKDEYKPYENALKKIKVDMIYSLNLNRIDEKLGKAAVEHVSSELDSVLLGGLVKEDKKPEKPNADTSSTVSRRPIPAVPGPRAVGATSPPLPLPPLLHIQVPKELIASDPYDLDHLDIMHEIGPMGIFNDMRRTFVSLFDPLLPMRIMEKETKKETKK